MSLLKVPVIVLLTLAYTTITGHTASARRAPKNEVIRVSPLESDIWMSFLFKTYLVQTLLGAFEVVTILAQTWPSFHISRLVISALSFQDKVNPYPRLTVTTSVGAILFFIGVGLRIRSYSDLGLMFNGDVTIRKDHRLITSGVYSFVRHPAYTGFIMAMLGWLLWTFGEGSWVRENGLFENTYGKTVIILYTLLLPGYGIPLAISRTPNEDAVMRKTFGKEWDNWANRVQYALIPGIY